MFFVVVYLFVCLWNNNNPFQPVTAHQSENMIHSCEKSNQFILRLKKQVWRSPFFQEEQDNSSLLFLHSSLLFLYLPLRCTHKCRQLCLADAVCLCCHPPSWWEPLALGKPWCMKGASSPGMARLQRRAVSKKRRGELVGGTPWLGIHFGDYTIDVAILLVQEHPSVFLP